MLWADASFLIGLLDSGDQWHEPAKNAARGLLKGESWHTHLLVVGEVIAVVGARRGGRAAREVYERVRDALVIEETNLNACDEAMIEVVRSDGALSLSDALLVQSARRTPRSAILSFDSDFDRTDVRRIPQA